MDETQPAHHVVWATLSSQVPLHGTNDDGARLADVLFAPHDDLLRHHRCVRGGLSPSDARHQHTCNEAEHLNDPRLKSFPKLVTPWTRAMGIRVHANNGTRTHRVLPVLIQRHEAKSKRQGCPTKFLNPDPNPDTTHAEHRVQILDVVRTDIMEQLWRVLVLKRTEAKLTPELTQGSLEKEVNTLHYVEYDRSRGRQNRRP